VCNIILQHTAKSFGANPLFLSLFGYISAGAKGMMPKNVLFLLLAEVIDPFNLFFKRKMIYLQP